MIVRVSDINQYGVSVGTFYNHVNRKPELLVMTKFSFRPNGLMVRDVTDFVNAYKKVMRRDLRD